MNILYILYMKNIIMYIFKLLVLTFFTFIKVCLFISGFQVVGSSWKAMELRLVVLEFVVADYQASYK